MTASPLPTMRDIADHLGVSRALVSMVLRGKPGPSADSRDRILAAAAELGYRPNTSAQRLRQQRTGLIGVLFDLRNPFQIRVVERLFAQAGSRGFGLALGPTTADRPTDAVVAELMEHRVEALIAFNPDSSAAALHSARQMIPLAWLGEWTDRPDVDNIHVNELEGLRAAVRHLVTLGHRDIAYIGGEGGAVGRDRADAYRQAMDEQGLGGNAVVLASGFREEDGAAAAARLLSRPERPTAVICCGDQCAVGVLAVLARGGVQVPQDISVIGFDDSYLAALPYHQLTSVHQDVEATADAALDAVISRLDAPESDRQVVATSARLVIRHSTAPPQDAVRTR